MLKPSNVGYPQAVEPAPPGDAPPLSGLGIQWALTAISGGTLAAGERARELAALVAAHVKGGFGGRARNARGLGADSPRCGTWTAARPTDCSEPAGRRRRTFDSLVLLNAPVRQ